MYSMAYRKRTRRSISVLTMNDNGLAAQKLKNEKIVNWVSKEKIEEFEQDNE